MNTYKAILDTRRPNGVIATITQFDNATLSLQIVTNGEIEHPWEAPQFELIAMKRDQQAVRESDQAAFTINDAGEHRVTVDLKEQFLTCRGSVKMQFIVKDGDRLSTSIFYVMVGESLDHDIIESHRDVAVLDELETYVKQGFDDLAYQEQRMKDVEKATHELNELMVGNEAERQAAEANRQALFEGNESQRQNTFNQQLTSQRREFDTSQADREGVFNALKQNLSSEFNAAQNEREREFDRVMASNQTQFNDAETSRASTFSHRQLENERTFTANENARQTLFNANEAGRQTNEAGRVSNENTRKTNEADRVAAEANRQQKMSEFEAKATQLSDELDVQVARVDAFVSANEEKLLGDRDKVDYMGNTHESVKAASDANVDWLLGEVNTAHYEGQHITATETIEGHAKSAILKGQTLVNLWGQAQKDFFLNGNGSFDNGVVTANEWCCSNRLELFKPNTEYTLITKVISVSDSNTCFIANNVGNGIFKTETKRLTSEGIYVEKVLSISDLTEGLYSARSLVMGGGTVKYSMIILEGDHTQSPPVDYFEGMQSVKMPVLTTTGKNLFNMNNCYASPYNYRQNWGELEQLSSYEYKLTPKQTGNDHGMSIGQNVSLKKGVAYTVSFEYGDNNVSRFNYFNAHYTDGDDSTIISWAEGLPKTFTFTPTRDIDYVWFCMVWGTKEIVIVKNIQIEQGSQATPFEPHKSNTLSTPEEVILRGFDSVEDTLNLNTREYVKGIGELTLNGSEPWQYAGNTDGTMRFNLPISDFKDYGDGSNGKNLINNKLPKVHFSISGNTYGVSTWCNHVVFYTEHTNVNDFKQWLSQNPTTIQYELKTPIVKTVALSDNHVYSYKDVTHYDCSSAEGSLVPTLSIDVPTNLPAVVTRQRATIQELEKENAALKNEIEETANSSVNGDLELMSSQFELDFRLFEIEMNLDMPMMATMRGVKSMAMTVYQQAKTLILAGKYEREDMEYKLNRYKAAGRITVEEYEELIALMDARELVD